MEVEQIGWCVVAGEWRGQSWITQERKFWPKFEDTSFSSSEMPPDEHRDIIIHIETRKAVEYPGVMQIIYILFRKRTA